MMSTDGSFAFCNQMITTHLCTVLDVLELRQRENYFQQKSAIQEWTQRETYYNVPAMHGDTLQLFLMNPRPDLRSNLYNSYE